MPVNLRFDQMLLLRMFSQAAKLRNCKYHRGKDQVKLKVRKKFMSIS